MRAQSYFPDSDVEFVNQILLLSQNRHKNTLREVPFGHTLFSVLFTSESSQNS